MSKNIILRPFLRPHLASGGFQFEKCPTFLMFPHKFSKNMLFVGLFKLKKILLFHSQNIFYSLQLWHFTIIHCKTGPLEYVPKYVQLLIVHALVTRKQCQASYSNFCVFETSVNEEYFWTRHILRHEGITHKLVCPLFLFNFFLSKYGIDELTTGS